MKVTRYILLSVAAVLLLAAFYGVLSGKSHHPQKRIDDQQEKAILPATRIDTPEPADPQQRRVRRLRNSRHDLADQNVDSNRFALNEASLPVLMPLPVSHAPIEAAFPVGRSDAIVIAKVSTAQAYLSNDKTAVYSEFGASVEQVISGEATVGSSIVFERVGGRVILKSGKELIRGPEYGRGMPLTDHTYLLFLKQDKEAQTFNLITGYEVTNQKVFPLDHTPTGDPAAKQFQEYEGQSDVDASIFFAQLQAALAHLSRVKN